jgi:hypothetical protein
MGISFWLVYHLYRQVTIRLTIFAAEYHAPMGTDTQHLVIDHPHWKHIWTLVEVSENQNCAVYCGASQPVSIQQVVNTFNCPRYDMSPQWGCVETGFRYSAYFYSLLPEVQQKKGKPECITDLILSLSELQSPKPKDVFLVLLAIVPDAERLGRLALFYAEPGHICRVLAKFIIEYTGDLKLLQYASQASKPPTCPSWAPDWSSVDKSFPVRYPWRKYDSSMPPIQLPSFEFIEDPRVLVVKGLIIDSFSGAISDHFPVKPKEDATFENECNIQFNEASLLLAQFLERCEDADYVSEQLLDLLTEHDFAGHRDVSERKWIEASLDDCSTLYRRGSCSSAEVDPVCDLLYEEGSDWSFQYMLQRMTWEQQLSLTSKGQLAISRRAKEGDLLALMLVDGYPAAFVIRAVNDESNPQEYELIGPATIHDAKDQWPEDIGCLQSLHLV